MRWNEARLRVKQYTQLLFFSSVFFPLFFELHHDWKAFLQRFLYTGCLPLLCCTPNMAHVYVWVCLDVDYIVCRSIYRVYRVRSPMSAQQDLAVAQPSLVRLIFVVSLNRASAAGPRQTLNAICLVLLHFFSAMPVLLLTRASIITRFILLFPPPHLYF